MRLPIRREHIPFVATVAVLVGLFSSASLMYDGFFSLRVVVNLFYDNAFLGVSAIGMTFVILSGGIDLSVGSVMAFTTIFVATLIGEYGLHPLHAMALALIIGSLFGAFMGVLIQVYRLPPFLVTLGGMFFARGMAFVVRMNDLVVAHPFVDAIAGFGIPLAERVRVPAVSLIFLGVFAVGLFLAHMTRFGRNVYAIGGSENSALLMGLPVGRTKILVYTFNGFCSALAGIVSTLYMVSGDPARGVAMELDAIAAVVIGGTLLTGGVGYVAGTLVGVLVFGTIQAALLFDGRLSAWWLRIAVGVLLFAFILLQRLLSRDRSKGEGG